MYINIQILKLIIVYKYFKRWVMLPNIIVIGIILNKCEYSDLRVSDLVIQNIIT